jgi:hypothetical protein
LVDRPWPQFKRWPTGRQKHRFSVAATAASPDGGRMGTVFEPD